jgi:hypothetical protein
MKNKLKNKIWGNTDLLYEEDGIQYELSALMHLSKDRFGEYTYPSLSFWKNKGMKDEEIIDVWDNEEYLYKKLFLGVLEPMSVNIKYDLKEFRHLMNIEGVEKAHLKGLYKLFKKAVLLGFFEEVN